MCRISISVHVPQLFEMLRRRIILSFLTNWVLFYKKKFWPNVMNFEVVDSNPILLILSYLQFVSFLHFYPWSLFALVFLLKIWPKFRRSYSKYNTILFNICLLNVANDILKCSNKRIHMLSNIWYFFGFISVI